MKILYEKSPNSYYKKVVNALQRLVGTDVHIDSFNTETVQDIYVQNQGKYKILFFVFTESGHKSIQSVESLRPLNPEIVQLLNDCLHG